MEYVTALNFEPRRQPGARTALLVLTFVNLLNYADRYVPSSVKELIKADLDLTDAETALPNSGMVLVYMVSAVCFAVINDRTKLDRRKVLACAIAFWSLATSLAGLATSLPQLVLYRSLVGVGEAAFGTIVPPFLSDFFPPSERNPVFGFFYLAIPVGGALGYGIGALVGSSFGWRVAFYVCGLPGVAIALVVLLLNDPPRGVNDLPSAVQDTTTSNRSSSTTPPPLSLLQEYVFIFKNKAFIVGVLGTSANLFALGGLADWYSSFAMRYLGSSLAEAGVVVGIVTIIAGIGGNLIGSIASQYWEHRVKSAYFLIPSLFTIPGAVFLSISLNVRDKWLSYCFMGLAEISLWTYLAPLSALSINVLEPELRARGMALAILIEHILGDVISPPIIGGISDAIDLRTALQVTWMAVIVSGMLWYGGFALLSPLPVSKKVKSSEDKINEEETGGGREDKGKSKAKSKFRSVHGDIFSLLLGLSPEEDLLESTKQDTISRRQDGYNNDEMGIEMSKDEYFTKNPIIGNNVEQHASLDSKFDSQLMREENLDVNSELRSDRKDSENSESELLEQYERSLV